MIEKLKNLSVEEIYTRYKFVSGLARLLALLLILLVIYRYSRGPFASYPFWLGAIFLVMGLLLVHNLLMNKALEALLIRDVNLEKYYACFQYSAQHTKGMYRKVSKHEHDLVKSVYHYFWGEFDQSLQALSKIPVGKVVWYRRRLFRFATVRYRLLNHLNQKNFTNYDEDLAQLQSLKFKNLKKHVEKIKAIHAVNAGQTTTYFDQNEPESRLDGISAAYYAGLNCLNQGDESGAKAKFSQIADENPDLFSVKEAKRHLANLTDDDKEQLT